MATNKQITSLSTLQIHKLSQAQYNEYVQSAEFDDYAIYLTPDEDDFVDRTEYERDISDITGEIDGILDSAEEWNLAYEHATSGHAPEDAEKNAIITIKLNNKPITPDTDRAVNIEVPIGDFYTQTEVNDLLKTTTITIDTTATTEGYAKSYKVMQGDNDIGIIDIPKDSFVESGVVVENPVINKVTNGVESQETLSGTYIVLQLVGIEEPLYINAGSLVENYTFEEGADEIQLDISERCISATIVNGSITKDKLSEDLSDELYGIVGSAEAAEAAALAAQEAAEAANAQVSASAATALAAQEAAEAAQLAATEAQDSAEASATAASGSQSAAEAAQGKAEAAQEAAEAAQLAATEAQDSAEASATAASGSQSAAEAAQGKAEAAQEAAEAAQSNAEASATAASGSQSAAEAAQSKAEAAQEAAEAAQSNAEGAKSEATAAAQTASVSAAAAAGSQSAAEAAQGKAEAAQGKAESAAENASASAAEALESKEAAEELYDTAKAAQENAQNALNKIGDISSLETNNKDNFVSALNEVLGLVTGRVAAQIIIWSADEGADV